MGTSAEELRTDIAGTRQDMSETLDAIGDRVSPGRIVERRKNRVVGSVQSVRDRVMGTASDARRTLTDGTGSAVDTVKDAPDAVRQQTQGNPLIVGSIAFGLGVLAAAVFPATRREQELAEDLMDRAEPLKQELTDVGKDVAGRVKDVAQQAATEVKDAATEGKDAVAASARESVEATRSTAEDATRAVTDQARQG